MLELCRSYYLGLSESLGDSEIILQHNTTYCLSSWHQYNALEHFASQA